ncbi:hypothetical protein QJS66_18775 [Kocuria rhizophila]|nr:hypothetical protein QJS66_18775 [Kocuria rhizophila]
MTAPTPPTGRLRLPGRGRDPASAWCGCSAPRTPSARPVPPRASTTGRRRGVPSAPRGASRDVNDAAGAPSAAHATSQPEASAPSGPGGRAHGEADRNPGRAASSSLPRIFETVPHPIQQPIAQPVAAEWSGPCAGPEAGGRPQSRRRRAARVAGAAFHRGAGRHRGAPRHPGRGRSLLILLRQGAGLRRTVILSSEAAGFAGVCDGELSAQQILTALGVLLGGRRARRAAWWPRSQSSPTGVPAGGVRRPRGERVILILATTAAHRV